MPKGIRTVRSLRMDLEQANSLRNAARDKYGNLRIFQEVVSQHYDSLRPDNNAMISPDAIERYLKGQPINPLPARAILQALNYDPRVEFLKPIADQKLANEEKGKLHHSRS